MISEKRAFSGWGLSVLRGVFALTKNGHFTGVLRGCRGRTIAEQDKAGSLGPDGPHRPATPTGEYGYVKGIPERYGHGLAQNPESRGFFRQIFRQIQAEIPA